MKRFAKDFLRQFYEKLDTDYIDVLFLHNCDDEADLNEILNGWMYAYAKELKDTGRVGFIGLSSHNTKIALNAVKSGKIDVLMFPVNPLFNLLPQDTADKDFENSNYDDIKRVLFDMGMYEYGRKYYEPYSSYE